MKAHEIMTTNPACCTPDDPAERAAKLMAKHDCGGIPVVRDADSRELVGMITDRDITLRAVAQGRGPDTLVGDLMSRDLTCCSQDSELEEVTRVMAERQVRRVPIVDGDGCCLGMIAQADVARAHDDRISDEQVGHVVEEISRPLNAPRAEADRPSQRRR